MGTIKIIQYTHRPNSTELGLGNTHETYMLINSETDLTSIFPIASNVIVVDSVSGKSYSFKSTSDKEFRVNQLGEYYRDNDVRPGDEITITSIKKGGSTNNIITTKKFNRIVLNVGKNGAEIFNLDRLETYSVNDGHYEVPIYDRGVQNKLSIFFKEAKKKRSDSPKTTDYYSVDINGISLPNGTHYLTLNTKSSIASLVKSDYNVITFEEALITGENLTSIQDISVSDQPDVIKSYLTAMRTKPFLLLAGISGTGKSRIVKEMAFDSCPDLGDLRKDKTTPGNYCLVEVKPNWHDSTELLGYESAIKNTFVLTPFVKFLAKAMKYENWENKVPFFVCLDEMNLAPVEQYFAEFLSVLESRKLVDGKITSEPLVDASHFKAHPEMVYELFDLKKEESTGYGSTEDYSTPYGIENELFDRLKNEGLRIPSNVVVIGTVNMDETTHQFSRKVIDRAMTIEMNIADGDEPFKSFFESNTDLDYREEAVDANVYLPQFASASNALQALEVNNHEDVVALKAGLPALLGELNQALNNTPFKIAYRVENELVLYFTALRQANEAEKADNLIAQAMDDIMMMKVLPRIEGDDELLTAPLQALNEFASKHSFANSLKKIEEMDKRLKQAHFTSFWP